MPPERDLAHDAQLLALTLVGGAMDALGYLHFHVFMGNMTGNAIVCGLAFGGIRALDAGRALIAILTFVVGVMAGTLLNNPRVTLLLEVVALVAFAVLWQFDRAADSAGFALLIAIGAGAMGLQTAATRQTHGRGAASTYMSGTLASAATGAIEALRDAAKAPGAIFSAATFVVYLLGAILVGTLGARHAGILALIPIASLATVFAVAVGRWRGLVQER
ncbi:MAG TPA: YoaK family protein [Candidatus Acidoferrum sp.]|nr:YoaK family protein [Candidatus Acidoferrum sp.]